MLGSEAASSPPEELGEEPVSSTLGQSQRTLDTHAALAELLLQVIHGAVVMGIDARGLVFVVVTEATRLEHKLLEFWKRLNG